MSLMSVETPKSFENRSFDPSLAKVLPLESCRLSVDASCGLARVRLVQRFRNPHQEPLSVTYKLPLPADGAVGGFAFTIGDRRIVGHVEGRKQARETFERAVLEGRSAALLEQDRSSLFTQEIGNIPPGAVVEAEIDIDQPLAWLSEGAWEWRFPLAAAPRYLGAGSVEGHVALDVATSEIGARASLELTIRDAIAEGRSPESPSHPLVTDRGQQAFKVELGSGNQAPLDRDVAVRWPAAASTAAASIDVARPGALALSGSAFGLLTIVPPAPDARVANVARDLTLLIDTSGSMSGEPLEQAKRVSCALVDSLAPGDQLEMIEFSYTSTSFEPTPRTVDAALKKRAIAWIKGLSASGGTEMLSGVKHAMRELRAGSQRQVILITDGLVGFEREIVGTLLAELPATARLHALGVGSAVNRSLLAPIARAGRGIEAIIGLGEDPERAAARILSRTVAPAVVDLVVEGSAVRRVVPSRLGDAYQGAPLRASLELDPAGGEVIVRGRSAEGAFVRSLRIAPLAAGEGSEAVVKLYGRELVEDLEMKLSAGEPRPLIDQQIERTGQDFAIATRLTSWVATTAEATVDPRAATRREVQPQALPYGMQAAQVVPSQAGPMMPQTRSAPLGMAAPGMAGGRSGFSPPPPPMGGAVRRSMSAPPRPAAPPAPAPARVRAEDSARKKEDSFGSARSEAPTVEVDVGEEGTMQAEEAEAKPQAKSLLGRVADRVIDALSGSEKRKAASARQLVLARIVLQSDGRLMIEVTVPASGFELGYDGALATVTLDDGNELSVELDRDRSAHEGSFAVGLSVKLCLLLPATVARTVTLARITLASGTLIEARV